MSADPALYDRRQQRVERRTRPLPYQRTYISGWCAIVSQLRSLARQPAPAPETGIDLPAIRILGPVEVIGPKGTALLSRGRQRALVAALALAAGTAIPSARLARALWEDADWPETAIRTLHAHVSRLRQSLRACGLPDDLLVTSGASYLLQVGRSNVDALYFEDLVTATRSELTSRPTDSALQRLRDGLALWRGDAAQDAELFGWAGAEAGRLNSVRLTAVEHICQAELQLGRPQTVIDELERLLGDNPGQEQLIELLMTALCRCGRPGDALKAYEQLRNELRDSLGSSPSPKLQKLHLSILNEDPVLIGTRDVDPLIGRPAQLPSPVGHFTGREDQMRALDGVLDAAADSRIAVVSGAGGMGKTALVVQWAHRVRDRFPDGQLFVDLRGHDEQTAMTATALVARALSALGAPSGPTPVGFDEQVALLRSLLHGRRVLIVLDNAHSVTHIHPLVPPTPTSMLVVTTRRPMPSLATFYPVRMVPLPPMDQREALRLLRDVVGSQRVDLEPVAALHIVKRCGYLPLALRIAAARLASQSEETLGALAGELSGESRLDVLCLDDGFREVRSLFASSYRSLSMPAARLFRRLGLHPGEAFGEHLAAAVAELPRSDVARTLAELVDAQLLTDLGDGYYRFHDLIRDYAAERARLEKDPDLYSDTVTRLVEWYVGIAEVANRTLDATRNQVSPTLSFPPTELPFAADPKSTLAFLDRERANLLPMVQFAVRETRYAAAWQLTHLLTGFFDSRGEWVDRVEMCQVALTAAKRLDDPSAESLMGATLGTAYLRMLRFPQALEYLQPAMERAQAAGDQWGESRIRNCIATAHARLRHYDEAVETYQEALAAHEHCGDRYGSASALNNIGTVRVLQDRPDLAFAPLDKALQLARDIRDARLEATILGSIGEAYLCQGAWEPAVKTFQQVLRIQQDIDDVRHQIDTFTNIGKALLAGDQHLGALDNLRTALTLSQALADQHLISRCQKSIAQAHLHRNEPDEASDCLRHALAARSAVPDAYEEAAIHDAMADVAERTGQDLVANEHRTRAESLYLAANAPAEAAGARSRRTR
jgi:DNA-binding SARP family transcriptional activator/Tfp pilus assembly protein PilF